MTVQPCSDDLVKPVAQGWLWVPASPGGLIGQVQMVMGNGSGAVQRRRLCLSRSNETDDESKMPIANVQPCNTTAHSQQFHYDPQHNDAIVHAHSGDCLTASQDRGPNVLSSADVSMAAQTSTDNSTSAKIENLFTTFTSIRLTTAPRAAATRRRRSRAASPPPDRPLRTLGSRRAAPISRPWAQPPPASASPSRLAGSTSNYCVDEKYVER